MELLIVLYGFACLGIGLGTAALAGRKGHNRIIAGFLAGILALASWTIGGLLALLIYALVPTKHIFCPKCGEPNIYYLTTCRHCGISLAPPVSGQTAAPSRKAAPFLFYRSR